MRKIIWALRSALLRLWSLIGGNASWDGIKWLCSGGILTLISAIGTIAAFLSAMPIVLRIAVCAACVGPILMGYGIFLIRKQRTIQAKYLSNYQSPKQEISSVNQRGGITAHTVNNYTPTVLDEPHVSVDAGNTLDDKNPLATRFTLTNHSKHSIYRVDVKAEGWDPVILNEGSAMVGVVDVDAIKELPKNGRFSLNPSFLTPIMWTFSGKTPRNLTVQIRVNFRYLEQPVLKSFRFNAEIKSDGTYAWFPMDPVIEINELPTIAAQNFANRPKGISAFIHRISMVFIPNNNSRSFCVLLASISNTGEKSKVSGWKLSIELIDGTKIIGTPPPSELQTWPQLSLPVIGSHAGIVIPLNPIDSLLAQLEGGLSKDHTLGGWIYFEVDPKYRPSLVQNGTRYNLSLQGQDGKTANAEHIFTNVLA